jgi:hypothetical protein
VASGDRCRNITPTRVGWCGNPLVLDGSTISVFSHNTGTICDKKKMKHKRQKIKFWNHVGQKRYLTQTNIWPFLTATNYSDNQNPSYIFKISSRVLHFFLLVQPIYTLYCHKQALKTIRDLSSYNHLLGNSILFNYAHIFLPFIFTITVSPIPSVFLMRFLHQAWFSVKFNQWSTSSEIWHHEDALPHTKHISMPKKNMLEAFKILQQKLQKVTNS